MLKLIKITNFCSIGETQEISFETPAKGILDSSGISIAGHNINLVNCIVGANASGKTTILKALSFLFFLINDSYIRQKKDENIPIDAHKLHEKDCTTIEIAFLNEGKIYQYKVELDKEKIHHESLYEDNSMLFKYTRQDDVQWDHNFSLTINSNDLERFKERKNVSVLSSLIATGYLPQMAFIKNYESIAI